MIDFFLGLQFFIYGLNGIKPFMPLPKQTAQLEQVVSNLFSIPQFVHFIKFYEILFGLALMFSFHPLLAKLFLAPLIFMIFFLQWTLNRQYSLFITMQLFVPFVISLYFEVDRIRNIFQLGIL